MKIVLADCGESVIGVYVDGKFIKAIESDDELRDVLETAGVLEYRDINLIQSDWPKTLQEVIE